EQPGARLVVREIFAAIDEAVADAVLERDPPLPAGIVRDRAGVGDRRADRSGLHGEAGVGGQPVAPVLIAGLQRLLDQEAAKAGAVDEQIALDPRARCQDQSLYEARLRMLGDLADPALDPPDAELLAE